MTAPGNDRVILHVDMDAFFAAVEVRDNPRLRGLPVVVGGEGDRGVVAAASYEARAHGIHSAMPSVRARRLCPSVVFIHGRHDRYAEVSRQVMATLGELSPLVEPISMDEAFIDVTGSLRRLGPVDVAAAELRERILDRHGLAASVGVASTKLVAKLASEAAKPRASLAGPVPGCGVVVVAPGDAVDFLSPMDAGALWGVGPATLERLNRLGVSTVGDLATVPLSSLAAALGERMARHLQDLANGIDERPVVADRTPRSIGHEETFASDLFSSRELSVEIVRLADAVSRRLHGAGFVARTVTIKVRFGDFRTITRSVTPPEPVLTAVDIASLAKDMLAKIDTAQGIRLVGVSVSGLCDTSVRQLSLDDLVGSGAGQRVDAREGWESLTNTLEAVRSRFGVDAIGPAAAVRGGGLEVKRQGDRQWGPGRDPDGGIVGPDRL